VTFIITFFCNAKDANASNAFAMLSGAISSGDNVRTRKVKSGDGWVASEITSAVTGTCMPPQEPVFLEIHSDQLSVQSTVKSFGGADDARIADTNLLVTITLVGQTRDWSVVRAVWLSVTELWPTVPCSDVSGFDISLDSLM
jgi:hypothetical protein